MAETRDEMNTHDARRELAERYRKDGRLEEAVSIYRVLVDAHPEQESYLLALAWACHDAGQMDAAIDCFERLLETELARDVFTGFAFDELVRIFKETRQFGRLVALCEKAVGRYPDDTGLLAELGHACLTAGDPGRAAICYKRMITLDPEDAGVFCRLGDALLAAGDLTGAEQSYGRAAELDAGRAEDYWARWGIGLLRAGALEQAETVLRRCLQGLPEEPRYRLHLGDCLIRRGKLREAEEQCAEAVRMDPASAGVYYNRLGNALVLAGHHRQAAECFRKAAIAEPANTFYRVRLAEACAAAGIPDAAPEETGEPA